MKKSWKTIRGNTTYDTDKYAFNYVLNDSGTLTRAVWPEDAYAVGPWGYNNSHLDLIYDNVRNRCDKVLSGPENPFYLRRSTLSRDKATFKP